MSETITGVFARVVRDAVRDSLADLRSSFASVATAPTTPSGPPSPAYVPVREAARIMSAHPVTVRKLIADGKLGRYSVEGKLRVKLTDIHAYMARASQPASGPAIDLDERARELLARRKSG